MIPKNKKHRAPSTNITNKQIHKLYLYTQSSAILPSLYQFHISRYTELSSSSSSIKDSSVAGGRQIYIQWRRFRDKINIQTFTIHLSRSLVSFHTSRTFY